MRQYPNRSYQQTLALCGNWRWAKIDCTAGTSRQSVACAVARAGAEFSPLITHTVDLAALPNEVYPGVQFMRVSRPCDTRVRAAVAACTLHLHPGLGKH